MSALLERPITRPATRPLCALCGKPVPADDEHEHPQLGMCCFGCVVDEAREADREAWECPGFDLWTYHRPAARLRSEGRGR